MEAADDAELKAHEQMMNVVKPVFNTDVKIKYLLTDLSLLLHSC